MNTKQSEKNIWVIIPVFNEEKYILSFLKKLLKRTKNVVIVDDGSSDTTYQLCKNLVENSLTHATNLGKGAALKTGAEYAFTHLGAESVIFMDGDDQHDPDDLDLFLKALQMYDVVFGVRELSKKMPLLRRIGNICVSRLVQFFYGTYIPDILCGFNGMSKEAFTKAQWFSRSYDIELELTVKTIEHKLNYTTVPVKTVYHDMDRGMTILDALRMISMLFVWRITK